MLKEVSLDSELEQEFSYDKLSRMVSASDRNQGSATNTVGYEYDAFDRVTAETQNGRRLAKQYDLNSNLTGLVYPSGKTVNNTYNSLNLLSNIVILLSAVLGVIWGILIGILRDKSVKAD